MQYKNDETEFLAVIWLYIHVKIVNILFPKEKYVLIDVKGYRICLEIE